MKRYVVIPEEPSRDHGHVFDRVNRGISNTYSIADCMVLANWLNWRDNGYPERRTVFRVQPT